MSEIYDNQINDINDRLERFEVSQVPVITDIFKSGNRELLEAEIEAIAGFQIVEYVDVSAEGGILVQAGSSSADVSQASDSQGKDYILRHYPLEYENNGVIEHLGTLTISASLKIINQNVKTQKLSFLKTQISEVIIVSIIMFILFYQMVGKHLIVAANFVSDFNLKNLDEPMNGIRTETEFNQNDEIGRLFTGINSMRENLKNAHVKNQVSEDERESLIKVLQGKNAELERFTYTVSHDLKSPLVTINGYIGMLEQDIKDNAQEDIYEDINTIKKAAKTMHSILNDLLELSRVGVKVGTRIEISFNDLLKNVLTSLSEQINSRHALIEIEENLPVVSVELIRFEELFLNLIENGLKYMGNQTDPLIQIGITDISKDASKPEMAFYVKDNGRGINPDYLDQVFELFERIAVDVEGTGVGLAIVKRIVEVHDGRIWVESEGLGKGAIFYFVLPLVERTEG